MDAPAGSVETEFAAIWQALPKVVFSTTCSAAARRSSAPSSNASRSSSSRRRRSAGATLGWLRTALAGDRPQPAARLRQAATRTRQAAPARLRGVQSTTRRTHRMSTDTIAAPPLVTPADADYDDARRAWNLAVEQRPAAVSVARTVDDVQAAIAHARAHGLRVAAQTTGHLSQTLPSLAAT